MLCRDLGWRSVDEMVDGLSNRELVWWEALYAVEAREREDAAEKQRRG